MGKYKWDIPEKCQKSDKDHVTHQKCIRLVSSSNIDSKDFLPSIVENPKRFKKWKKHTNFTCKAYAVSLVDSFEKSQSLAYIIKKYFVAQGNTTYRKGVSPKANKDGHISYFLFDYKHNSPYDDFNVITKIGDNYE